MMAFGHYWNERIGVLVPGDGGVQRIRTTSDGDATVCNLLSPHLGTDYPIKIPVGFLVGERYDFWYLEVVGQCATLLAWPPNVPERNPTGTDVWFIAATSDAVRYCMHAADAVLPSSCEGAALARGWSIAWKLNERMEWYPTELVVAERDNPLLDDVVRQLDLAVDDNDD
jgi:hypothetical protein